MIARSIDFRFLFFSIVWMLVSGCSSAPIEKNKGISMKDNHQVASQVEGLLDQANIDISNEKWKDANESLQKGIELLGEQYLSQDIVDDTGMKLIVANMAASKGDWEAAATVKEKILFSRLQAFQSKIARSSKVSE
ncbi:hypothetical protein D3C71_1560170 [compost metagenome]